jgi:LuxR family maltose regulon positive regulatory protein
MVTPLLKTKLSIPPHRPTLVKRPRLIEHLDDGLRHEHPLTLISAPAGFGKTTLVTDWLSHLEEEPVTGPVSGATRSFAWLSLDDDDNDLTRFLAYLLASIDLAQPGTGADATSLLQSRQPAATKAALTLLINDLAALPNDLVLVLDDYHAIEQQPIHDALSFLIQNLPPQMHLVLSVRVDPPLPLARMRTRGQLTELRGADLRFTPDETATFLNQAMGLGLSADNIDALEARTEGWIAGLQLAAVALQSLAPGRDRSLQESSEFVRAFTGSQRYVLDYLTDEVLRRQPEEIRTFLLETSVLNRLSGPLCDAITGRQDSDIVLRKLEQANLFLVPLDAHREWYRYHRLFSDFLRSRLRHELPGRVADLHCWAADWHEAQGFIPEAIDHALAAQDFERAAQLISGEAERTLMRSEMVTFMGWAEALPPEMLKAMPRLSIYYAWMLIMDGHPLEEAEERLREAEQADTAGAATGELAVVRMLIALYQGNHELSARRAERALELLGDDRPFMRSLVAGVLGLNCLYRGDCQAARQALTEAATMSRRVGNVVNHVLALTHLAEISVLEARLREAQSLYTQAYDAALDSSGRLRPIGGLPQMGLGQLEREWNHLEEAGQLMTQGIELCLQWAQVATITGYVGLARTKQALGDSSGALAAIDKAQNIAERFDAMETDDMYVAAYAARLSLDQGSIPQAVRTLQAVGLTEEASRSALEEWGGGALPSFYTVMGFTALAQVLIAQGKTADVFPLLEPLLQATDESGWAALSLELLLLKSIALHVEGHEVQALDTLQQALSLGKPSGFVRVFIEKGAPLAHLLASFLRQRAIPDELRSYAQDLLDALVPEGYAPPKVAPAAPQGMPSAELSEPLTDREFEVLRLIARGLSNRMIADRLVIAVSTVKTHINNIYRKLDVSNRTQAAARAADLGLL